MGDVPHRVFQNLHPVGALHERGEARADLALAGRSHLVVMHLHFDALLLEREHHSIADVVQGVHRGHREIAALDGRAVAHVA
jgi:hypothetical protein